MTRSVTLALMIVLVFASAAMAQPAGTSGATAATKEPPTDKAIMEMCGSRLAKVFSKFGLPEDLVAVRGSDIDQDSVKLSYGSFGFQVRDKTVTVCFYWADWKGTVRGVAIGDAREKVLKTMGAADHAEKNKDEVDDLGWELKGDDAVYWVVFDKDNKVVRIQVELK